MKHSGLYVRQFLEKPRNQLAKVLETRRPALQHDDGETKAQDVLLKRQILVGRDQRFEFGFGRAQQVPIHR